MPTSTEEAKALLERVLQEPFEFFEPSDEVFDFHVLRWFKYLIGEFPLWTWQPYAFNRLHDTELPTTYPVDDLIESVLEDEGIDPSYQASGQPLDALSFNLDRRRSGIASGSPLANATLLEGASASLTPGIVQFRYARDLTDWEPAVRTDADSTPGVVTWEWISESDDPSEARRYMLEGGILEKIDAAQEPEELPSLTDARSILGDGCRDVIDRLIANEVIEQRVLRTGRAGKPSTLLMRPGQFTDEQWEEAETRLREDS